jgi:hypothetical protein
MPGMDHGLKSFKDTLAIDTSVVLYSLDTLRKLFKIKQTDLMAVGCTVECNGTAPGSRTQYSDVHIVILLISLSDRKLLLPYRFADRYEAQVTTIYSDIRRDFLLQTLKPYTPSHDSHMSVYITFTYW